MKWCNHPGKKVIAISSTRVRPMLRVVVNAEVDGTEMAAALTARLKDVAKATIHSYAAEILECHDDGFMLECTEEEMLTVDDPHEREREGRGMVGDEYPDIPWVPKLDSIDPHPDDGNQGVWLVSGIRHSCVVRGVSTARQALDRALASGDIGGWEVYAIKFIGDDLPDVIRVS